MLSERHAPRSRSPGPAARARRGSRSRSPPSSSGTLRDGVFWVPLAGPPTPSSSTPRSRRRSARPTTSPASSRGKQLLLLLDNFEHLLEAAPAVSAVLGASSGVSRARHEPCAAASSRRAASTGSSRSRRATPRRSSSSGPARSGASSRRTPPSRRSAAASTASRSRSSSPPRGRSSSPRAAPRAPRLGAAAPDGRRARRAGAPAHAARDDRVELRPARLRRAGALRALSVFAGSFPLEAAEEVCGADLDGLAALVDSSLVKPIGDDRFLMLETIREYALERLADGRGRRAAAAARRLLRRARRARRTSTGSTPRPSGRRGSSSTTTTCGPLSTGWSERTGERALELAGALGWFWLSHGLLDEGCARLAEALPAPTAAAARGRGRSRRWVAHRSFRRRRRGREQLDEAIALWRELG